MENHLKIKFRIHTFHASLPECIFVVYTLLNVVSHYDLSGDYVPCREKKLIGGSGCFYLDFWNLFNFANPISLVPVVVLVAKRRFDFLFVYAMNFRVCLPDVMENTGNCHGKVLEFYEHISVGTLVVVVSKFTFSGREFGLTMLKEPRRCCGVCISVCVWLGISCLHAWVCRCMVVVSVSCICSSVYQSVPASLHALLPACQPFIFLWIKETNFSPFDLIYSYPY